MKKNYLLLFCIISISAFSQNKKEALLHFDASDMETSILAQKSALVDVTTYNQKNNTNFSFYQAYKIIEQGDLQNRLQPLQNIKEQTKQSYFTKVIPLAILHSEFESITDAAMQNNLVTKDAQGHLLRSNPETPIFEKSSLTIASPLRKTTKGLQTTFRLDTSNIFNTTDQNIKSISIDFNNGEGFKNVNLDQNIIINYSEEGKKTLNFILTLDNGKLITRTSSIEIKYSNQDLYTNFNRLVTTFNANLPENLLLPYGETTSYPGTAEYEIFASDDGVIDKPIFLVDGFDPGDGRDITGLYDLLNFDDGGTTSNLGDLVREEGFDVIILNFPIYTRGSDIIDGGVDFIERNAMLLVDLINYINVNEKVGDAKNVIIGPSMGGLISRYALNYMEDPINNMDHETRLWISFDAPHLGANVPIGFQHQFNFLAFGLDDFWILGDQNVEELQPIIDGMLRSSAARQMLVDQFEPHITNSDGVTFNDALALPRAHYFKEILDGRMNSATNAIFPELTRNVSIINGSGENLRYPNNTNPAINLNPGSKILDADINVMTGADMLIETYFTPNSGTQIRTSKVHLDFAWWFPLANDRHNNVDSRAFEHSNGVDAASGGLFDILGLTADLATDGLVGEFLGALNTDHFNFIPSVSAMSFVNDGEINWFHQPNGVTTARTTSNTTPFDAWYMPIENQPHVTLTEGNVAFALNEIFQETLSVDNTFIDTIKLEQNPITDALNILSTNTFENAKITIVDVTGKVVYKNHVTLSERTSIPLQIASGLYILNIETQDNHNLKTKFLVN